MQGGDLVNLPVDQMLRVYPQFLFGTPLGIASLFIGAVMVVLTAIGDRIKWVWVATLIYVIGLGVATVDLGSGNFLVANNLLPPLQQIRDLNRPLAIFLMFLLAVRALFSSTGLRFKGIGAPMWAFFVFQIFTCVVLVAGGTSFSRGLIGTVVYILVFSSIALGMGRWLVRLEDGYTVLRTVLAVTLLLIGGVILHLLVRSSSMYLGGRLTGTTSNPQFLGAFLAFALPSCYGLLLKRDEWLPRRIAAGCAIVLSIILILMSGSRSAVIVTLIGIIVFFRRRLGQLLLMSLVALAVVLAAFQLGIGDNISSHIYSTGNTRADVWRHLWQEFLAHPIFGVGSETGAGESSYLSVLAIYGIVGFIPFSVAIGLMMRDSIRIVRRRRQLGEHAILADVALASLAAILHSGIFDNHLLATLAPPVYYIFLFLALYALLLDPSVSVPAPDGEGLAYPLDRDPFGYYRDDAEMGLEVPGGFGEPVRAVPDAAVDYLKD